jgi:outer membrane protein insertion porin family/translocation and assembly module TamA
MIPCGRRAGWVPLLAVLLAISARASSAQDLTCGAGDVEVMRLTFQGNRAFPSGLLEDGIVTSPSSWARRNLRLFGKRNCLDRDEFPRDRLRLIIWYRNHGYASVAVDTAVTPMGKGKVAVRFLIHEGAPTIVDTLVVTGLDSVPAPERAALVKGLPSRVGRPFDKYANDTTREVLTQRLHDGGYPDAEVFIGYNTRTAERRASVAFTVSTGPRMHLGPIAVKVDPRPGASRVVSDGAVRHVADLRQGALYSQQDLERAKQALYQTEAFTRVQVIPDSTRAPGDSTVPVTLALGEGYMHDAHAGIGYGTLDCFRTTADYTDYSVLGSATRLDLHGRLSKIGVGEPLSGLGALCPIAQSDLYSKDLNYFTGATISRPAIFHEVVPSYSLYSERRSEFDAYLRTTPIGGNMTLARPLGRVTEALSYSVEFGRTEAQPALLCAVFNACQEADRESVERLQRLAVASASVTRDGSDSPVDPTRGTVMRVEFRTAGAYTGSDPSLHFNKVLVDGSAYMPIGSDKASPAVVLAARLRLGAVLGSSFSFTGSSDFIPQQERLFAGGQSSVRGYEQNELGPAVYIPLSYDTVRANGMRGGDPSNPADTVYIRASNAIGGQRTIPTGGNALAVANLEARIRSPILPDILQWALFVDGGAVWNQGTPGEGISINSLRWTPGFGARIRTQVGVLRVDLAYNPYRQPPGAAYYDAPLAAGGALYCVSPDNTLRVTAPPGGGAVQQAAGSCPASFQPPLQAAWWRRFAFVLTLGEAF